MVLHLQIECFPLRSKKSFIIIIFDVFCVPDKVGFVFRE